MGLNSIEQYLAYSKCSVSGAYFKIIVLTLLSFCYLNSPN